MNIKKVIISACLSLSVLAIVYGIVIPKIIESKEGEMKELLMMNGYVPLKMKEVNACTYSTVWSVVKGGVKKEVKIVLSNGGMMIQPV